MPDTQTGRGDVSQSTPGEPFEDPYGPWTSVRRRIEMALQFVFDDPGEFVDKLVEDVLSRPAAERFAVADELLREHLAEEFGSPAAFENRLPVDRAELLEHLRDEVERALDETLQGVFFHRDASGHLVVAAALESIRWAVGRTLDDPAGTTGCAATAVTVFCRLYSATTRRSEETPTGLLRDVVRAVNAITGPDGAGFDVTDRSDADELRRMVDAFGAVVAYRDIEISVGRGAELAGRSREGFEELLDRFGVEPRYGPSSVEDLREDALVDE